MSAWQAWRTRALRRRQDRRTGHGRTRLARTDRQGRRQAHSAFPRVRATWCMSRACQLTCARSHSHHAHTYTHQNQHGHARHLPCARVALPHGARVACPWREKGEPGMTRANPAEPARSHARIPSDLHRCMITAFVRVDSSTHSRAHILTHSTHPLTCTFH